MRKDETSILSGEEQIKTKEYSADDWPQDATTLVQTKQRSQ
jgi:hypothetical protein